MGRVLGTVLVLAALMLGGCSGGTQTNPPAQGEKEDVERAVEERPETTARVAEGYTVSEQASAAAEVTSEASALPTVDPSASVDTSRMENFDCRIQTYAIEEGMDAQGSQVFAEEMADRLVEDMEAGGNKDVGDILDDMGVPAYEEQCGPPL